MSSGSGRLRRFVRRAGALLRPGRAEADLSREIGAHLQLIEDQYVSGGMSREEARSAARRAFGGVEQAKEMQRDERSFRLLAGWPMDLKLGARMLVKSPGLTVVAVIALAIAIGAGAAYREFTNDWIHPTLDGPGADRLVGIQVWNTERRKPEWQALADFVVWRDHAATVEAIGAAVEFDRSLVTEDGRTAIARAAEISATAFRLLQTAPVIGRTLREADERSDAAPVAVIGHELWQERFDGDPNVLARTVRIGAVPHAIVGVMPEGFGFPINQNLWTPLKARTAGLTRGEGPGVIMFGRVRDGVSVEAAQAELTRLLTAAPGATPPAALRADVQPYLDSLLYDDRGGAEEAIIHSVNVVFILLLGICGANVATLVFARTAMRESEITVRTALGASRARISAQLFAEALVLSSLAAVAGLLAARYMARWATGLLTQQIRARPFWWDDGLSISTVAYAFALAVIAALIVGVVPALKATGARLQGRLRDSASGTSTMKFGGMWTGVIVVQAALTVVFLAAVVALGWAGVRRHWSHDVTYDREQLLTARVVLETPASGRPDAPAETPAPEMLQAIAEKLRAEPGVANVSYTTSLPGTTFEQVFYEFESPDLQADADARRIADGELWSAGARVGAQFFDTAGLSTVAGRTFTESEALRNSPVVIVDEAFVRVVLGGRNPIGVALRERPRRAGQEPGRWLEIVGVVRDATTMQRKGADDAVLYRPAMSAEKMRLLVRTHGAASPMAQRVQLAAMSVHPALRLVDLESVSQLANDEALPERIFLRAFSVITAVALLLATAGIYALISFTLARRTREIGIRAALGASPRGIITAVFSRAFTQIGIGLVVGALPGFVIVMDAGGDALQISSRLGAAAIAGVCAFVAIVALLSCAVPLRRALHIDPIKALRTDA
jgi:predicted permease